MIMKQLNRKKYLLTAFLVIGMISCSDILEEKPRSIFTPEYFKTEKGVMGGITSLYAHLRYIYGNGYWSLIGEMGTDEATYGHGGDGNVLPLDYTGKAALTPSSCRADVLWNQAFPNINTANGIIENALEVGTISNALIAEARFFRAFDYFMLVQTFGGVPLDLGAGELKFNTSTSRFSIRNTVPEVYTRAIFPDLISAVNDLPEQPRLTGTATKTLARLYLAKAYLTYGWWLDNPNDIPTYPECNRIDPDGHDAQWYFQQAYEVAVTAIDNPGPFKLQATYYDVNLAQNDRHSEMLLYADHTESSEYYDGSSHSYNTGSSPGNFADWFFKWDYTFLQSFTDPAQTTAVRSVQREAAQAYGRPWKMMCPPIGLITNTFSDKINDSRYDGSFVTTFRGNWPKGGIPNSVLYNANGMPVSPGDPILTFLDKEPTTPIVYPVGPGKSNVGAGELPGRADWVIGPREISRYSWPNLWKLGPYRTDNGTGLGQPNGGITRPFPIAKFSELYFIAAEAAVKGATPKPGKSARDLINVIRARAGKWRWANNGNAAKVQDNSATMIAATPASIDINYILEERSREYYGEGYRWFDLTRTQKWEEFSSKYEICGLAYGVGDRNPIIYTRTIEKYHYLRPIPTGQIDGLEMTAEEKAAYQNPGY